MRAVVVHAPKDCRIDEESEPSVAPGKVKVRVRYSSLVKQNADLYTGVDPRVHHPGNPLYEGFPIAQVGEVVGEAVEVGEGVTGVRPGDLYATYTNYREIHVIGPNDWTRVERGVRPEAAISHAYAGTSLHAVRRARLALGDDVLIIGAGPMGALLVPWARLAGAGRIIVADLHPLRRDTALRLGATDVIDPRATDLAAAVREITGGNGPDVVFDAGNVAATFPLALEMARPQGKIVVLSWHTQPITIQDITRDFYQKEVEVIATRGRGPNPSYRSPYVRWTSLESQKMIARWMGDGRFDPSPIITGRRPLAEFVSGLDDLLARPENHVKTLIEW